jgi:hypothetical protein
VARQQRASNTSVLTDRVLHPYHLLFRHTGEHTHRTYVTIPHFKVDVFLTSGHCRVRLREFLHEFNSLRFCAAGHLPDVRS